VLGGQTVLGRVFPVVLGGGPVAVGCGPVRGWLLCRPRFVQLADEVVTVPGGMVTVLAAEDSVHRRQAAVACVFRRAVVPLLRCGVAFLGLAVALLGSPVALVAAAQHCLHVRSRQRCISLPALSCPVALVGFTVAPIGRTITPVRVPVARVRILVASIRRLVPNQRPRGVLAIGGSLVTSIGRTVAVHGGLIALLGFAVTPSHPDTRLGRIPLVGDPVALVGVPVALVGVPVAFVGDACALALGVGAAQIGIGLVAWLVGHLASPVVRLCLLNTIIPNPYPVSPTP
jgi:hypothetical protein